MGFNILKNGDDKSVDRLNENFEMLSGLIGDSDSTDWSMDGIVVQNGMKFYQNTATDSGFGYKLTRISSTRILVELNIVGTMKPVDLKQSTIYFKIPAIIKPTQDRNVVTPATSTAIMKWDINNQGNIYSHSAVILNGAGNDYEHWLPIQSSWTIDKK